MRWPPALRVAVNLSPAQLRGGDLLATVVGILERTGLPAARLELELTEGMAIEQPAEAFATLDALSALGIGVVLDDFGAGHAGFGHLHRFAFSKLKIDRSFVAALTGRGRAAAVVVAMLAVGRTLGLDVTAEGVETPAQLPLLRAEGCASVQGALLGEPMPGEAVPAFLRDRPRAAGFGRDLASAAQSLL